MRVAPILVVGIVVTLGFAAFFNPSPIAAQTSSVTTIGPPVPQCGSLQPQDGEQADFGTVTTTYNGGDIEAGFVICGQPYTYGQIRIVVEFAWVNRGEWEVNGTTVSFTFDGARHYVSSSCSLGYSDYEFPLNLTHQGGYYDPTLKRVLPTVYAGQGDICFQHTGTYSPAFIVNVPNLGSFRIYQNMRVPYALTITDAPLSATPQKTIFGHTVNDPDNWLYVTVVSVLVIAIYISLSFWIMLRKKPRFAVAGNVIELVVGGLLIVFLGDLLYASPYDLQLFSVQTLAILVVIVALVAFHVSRQHLLNRLKHQDESETDYGSEGEAEKAEIAEEVEQSDGNADEGDQSNQTQLKP